ncbi:MAG: ABC transporter ATP-binding protein [Verrucomicrobiota bacterium]|nr:ABC transporter ATP-binding protein [Verrucomicrobiota bacterium]
MNNPASLIQVENLVKNYRLGAREVQVLRGVTLSIEKGAFQAFRGASGAGKSTLLHLLGGLDTPDSGSILWDGTDIARLSPAELSRFRNRKIGYIFQAYHLLPEFDAVENVCIPARMARTPIPALIKKAKSLLERVGLKDRFDHRPYELSGGEQQRVAIARALINDPEVIIADEPTGNLDSHAGEEIMNLLCALRTEQNATLLIATHDDRVAARASLTTTLVDGLVTTSASMISTPLA